MRPVAALQFARSHRCLPNSVRCPPIGRTCPPHPGRSTAHVRVLASCTPPARPHHPPACHALPALLRYLDACRALHRYWRVARSERRECDPRDSLPAAASIQRPPSIDIQRPCMFVQRGRNHNPAAPCIRTSSQGMPSRRVAPSRGVFPRPSPSASLPAFTCIRGSSPPVIIHAPTPTLVPVPVGARLILIL